MQNFMVASVAFFLVVFCLNGCENTTNNLNSDADFPSETDADILSENDGQDSAEAADPDKELIDGDLDIQDGEKVESDFEIEDASQIPAAVNCWKYSSTTITLDFNEQDAQQAACERADAGHECCRCEGIEVNFYDSKPTRRAVQCIALPRDWDIWEDITELEFMWLGSKYSFFWNNHHYGEQRSVGLIDMPGGLGYGIDLGLPEVDEALPSWSDDQIADVLAHDEPSGTCEDITDYRECVRSFIPPNRHCTPVIGFPWDQDPRAIWDEDPANDICCFPDDPASWEVATFIGCVTHLEPYNFRMETGDETDWLTGVVQNTATGECWSYFSDPAPPKENWVMIDDPIAAGCLPTWEYPDGDGEAESEGGETD